MSNRNGPDMLAAELQEEIKEHKNTAASLRVMNGELADALQHAIQRNHEFNPSTCSGCYAGHDVLKRYDKSVGHP